MDVLDRYEPLVEEFDAFRAACERPLPNVVRVNGIKATPERVVAAFEDDGIAVERRGWHDGVLELDTGSPGNTWPYVHGWVHGQEEVSAVPARVLDPKPGERVLDACAAPGSKTSQLADLMADTGTLVANDDNLGRLSALRSNCDRLGVTCAAVTNRDGRNFSTRELGLDGFDGVLVDAPCTCEGTIRKNPDALDNWSEGYLGQVAGTQKGILRRAIELTEPGGTVVYSTCTFAPEENEAVLDHVLAEGDAEVVPFELDLETRPGITEWNGEAFDAAVSNAKRIYPHLNDTGGFFCAKLEVGR
jgi:NOL1/NOP2/sun family putative RNA methylase